VGGVVGSLTLLVLDANVLIDFVSIDRSVLRRLTDHVRVLVPVAVLREVGSLRADEAVALGLELREADDRHLDEVARVTGGPLSLQDRLCLALARDESAVCVTNDRALQRACVNQSVPWMWGLTPLVHLVAFGAMTRADAVALAEGIAGANPFQLRPETLQKLQRLLSIAESGTLPDEALPRTEA
jgi:rRNA-processing protein FCF1